MQTMNNNNNNIENNSEYLDSMPYQQRSVQPFHDTITSGGGETQDGEEASYAEGADNQQQQQQQEEGDKEGKATTTIEAIIPNGNELKQPQPPHKQEAEAKEESKNGAEEILPPTTSSKYLPYKLLLRHNKRPFFAYLLEKRVSLLILLNFTLNVLAGATYGYNLSIVAGVLDPIQIDFAIVFKGRGNIASGFLLGLVSSCYIAGGIIGCVVGGFSSDLLGRKATTFMAGGVTMLGAVLGSVSPEFWFLNLTRVLVGIGNSMLIVACPMMVAEVAFTYAPRRAGMIGASLQFGIAIGIFLGYVMSFAFMDVRFTWRYMFALCNIVCGPLMIFSLLVPESPTWINQKLAADIMKQDNKLQVQTEENSQEAEVEQTEVPHKDTTTLEAEEVLDAVTIPKEAELEGSHKDEMMSVPQPKVAPKGNSFFIVISLFCTLRNIRRLLVGFVLVVCMTWLGINAILFYSTDIFKAAGLKTRTGPILASIGLGGWIVLTTFLSLLSDVLGRRLIIVPGVSLMTISCIVLGFMFQFVTNDTARGITSIAMVCLYFVGFNGLLGATYVPYLNELFTTDVRVIAVSFLLFMQWVLNLILGLIFLPVKEAVGQSYIFWFFGVVGIIAVIMLVIFMPETKNELSSKKADDEKQEETKEADTELVEVKSTGLDDHPEMAKAEGDSESKTIGVIVLEDYNE